MTNVRQSVELAADREQVWRYVTNPENFADYVAGYAGGRVTTPNDTGAGAAYAWTGKLGPLRVGVEERVVRWDDGREVAYEGKLGPTRFGSSVRVEDAGPSATRLVVGIDYRVPALLGGRATESALRPLVQADVETSLGRLRARFGAPGRKDAGPTPAEVASVYRKRARRYDTATQLYRLAFPLARYRRLAADALALRPGATVVEIGCGTGANFPLLEERVGPEGRIIGVDLTPAMLDKAKQRVAAAGWRNVELVQSDAARFAFPENVDGIVSTLALTLSPDFEQVIERGAAALAPAGRWVILDLKLPERWPSWLLDAALALTLPYILTKDAASRHAWEALKRAMPHTRVQELYFGATYLAVGIKT